MRDSDSELLLEADEQFGVLFDPLIRADALFSKPLECLHALTVIGAQLAKLLTTLKQLPNLVLGFGKSSQDVAKRVTDDDLVHPAHHAMHPAGRLVTRA